jgi:pimeloyl-[acyl-carrier protein] methyl ester esterase
MANNDSRSTWILLRGLAREKGHWGSFVEQFAASFPDDEVLAIDLPGFGEHREDRSPMQMSGIFDQVRGEAIARVRKQGKFKLLTVSLGAMVAMEWLKQKSEELSACVLINSSSRALSPVYQRLRWQVWPQFVRLLAMQNVRDRERAIIELLMNNPEAREQAFPQWTKIANEHPVSYVNFLNQLLAAANFKGLDQLESGAGVPTLILSGLGDRFVDPSCSTRLHERFHWPIHRHPWAGHDLPWDDPQWVIEKVGLL